ncbi:hypothetical protein [Dentiradicibacter hellwigii]|uniref:Uncharacterized protein n=1 Tax=Dentiradicibacter hellwigii TaxID=3149053 RepID=A0ABV4UEU3_9RHOO
MIPLIQMYLAPQCPSDSYASIEMATAAGQLRQLISEELFVKFQQSKGCIYQEPFSTVLIGYSLFRYDIELFEQYTNFLFEELHNNQAVLSKLVNTPSVVNSFVININLMGPEERPYFYLSSTQISFLAEIRASLFFDGYLMFGDEEESK